MACQALSAAVDLLRIPSQVHAMRSAPLPSGILLLLRLAAEDAEAKADAERMSKRTPEDHRDAAIFFIEQILLADNADAFRVLGVDKTASSAEMRQHMVYLLKWLHPDRNGEPHKAYLARRVLLAWNELRTARNGSDTKSMPGDPPKPALEYLRKRPLGVTRKVESQNAKARRAIWLQSKLRVRSR